MTEIYIPELSPIRRHYLLYSTTQYADYFLIKSCMKENRTLPTVILDLILKKVELIIVGHVLDQWGYTINAIVLHNDIDNSLYWTRYFTIDQKMQIFNMDRKFKKQKSESFYQYMNQVGYVDFPEMIREANNYLKLF